MAPGLIGADCGRGHALDGNGGHSAADIHSRAFRPVVAAEDISVAAVRHVGLEALGNVAVGGIEDIEALVAPREPDYLAFASGVGHTLASGGAGERYGVLYERNAVLAEPAAGAAVSPERPARIMRAELIAGVYLAELTPRVCDHEGLSEVVEGAPLVGHVGGAC